MDVDNGASQAEVATTTDSSLVDGSFLCFRKSWKWKLVYDQWSKVLIEHVYFGFDKYDLTSINKEKLMSNASKLSALNSDTTVKVLVTLMNGELMSITMH